MIYLQFVPDFNANTDELKKIGEFLHSIKYKSIEVLPYHRMSEHKYQALNMPFTSYPLPDTNDIQAYKNISNNYQKRVCIA